MTYPITDHYKIVVLEYLLILSKKEEYRCRIGAGGGQYHEYEEKERDCR
jgi:hypothetical protein